MKKEKNRNEAQRESKGCHSSDSSSAKRSSTAAVSLEGQLHYNICKKEDEGFLVSAGTESPFSTQSLWKGTFAGHVLPAAAQAWWAVACRQCSNPGTTTQSFYRVQDPIAKTVVK